MNYNSEKEAIELVLKRMKSELVYDWDTNIIKSVEEFEEDLRNDFFTIVVLGEFKRGKSTFVNSLLEMELLPTDVIPTTATINALMYSDLKETVVVRTDGATEKGESTLKFLQSYVATEDFDVDKIKYLKIGYPAEILKDKVVIVDTPGVSDINEQRAKVTYDFIPRADGVIFLLDSTAPLKKTEKEFIDEHLVKIGLDRILFVANRFDEIDEEDEDEVLDDILDRLKNAFTKENQPILKDLTLLPVSAKMALDGTINGDRKLIERSGIDQVRNEVRKIIEEGSVSTEKVARYNRRLSFILRAMKKDINGKISLYNADLGDLKKTLENVEAMLKQERNRKEKITIFIANEREKIQAMIRKSVTHFHVKLKDEVLTSIENYKGIDFKDFVEKQLTTVIKKNMSRWVDTYYIYIDSFFEKLEKELATGLATYFNTRINISNQGNRGLPEREHSNYIINIEAEDISNVTTTAGLISAGTAGIMTLIGGPIVLPFVSMAAFPFLQKKMLEGRLKEAKIAIKPEVNAALDRCIANLHMEIEKDVIARIESITKTTEETYNSLFTKVASQIQVEVERRESKMSDIHSDVNLLNNQLDFILEMESKLNC